MSIGLENGKNGASQSGAASEKASQVKVKSDAPATAVSPIQPAVTMNLVPGCPHLGVIDDAETRFLFASPVSTCYRANPAGQVSLEHQQAYCLGQRHVDCPVFRAASPGALPGNIQLVKPRKIRRRYWAVSAFALLAVVTAVFFLLSSTRLPAGPATDEAQATPLITAAAVALLPTSTATTTATQTAVPTATVTPLPTATPRPTDIPATATTLPPTFTVAPPKAPEAATATAVPLPVASVIVRLLNVREGPGLDYTVVGAVAEGDTLDVIGQNAGGGWWQVCCVAGQPGWVISEAVTLTGEAANVPVVRITPVP